MIIERLWARMGALLYDPFLALGERRGMAAHRRDLLAPLHGRVLEVGAGTGLNVRHYPGAVEELVLSEPEPAFHGRLRRRAGDAATIVAAPAEALPFADASFDFVVSTLVLCTVADPAAAVRELRRVLRPGGRLVFIEHVRAGSPRLARRQDRLERLWRAFASGCRCNRPTLELLAGELRLGPVTEACWRGMPAIVRPLAIGEARP
jgi:ubiquinone/menaquinone biosynthesis C-methylase UbiE